MWLLMKSLRPRFARAALSAWVAVLRLVAMPETWLTMASACELLAGTT